MAGVMSVGMLATLGLVGTAGPTGAAVVRTCSATSTPSPLPVGQSVHEVVTGFDPNESITESVSRNGAPATDSTVLANAAGVYDFNSGAAPHKRPGRRSAFTGWGRPAAPPARDRSRSSGRS